jgi:hypothetical protein
MSARTWGGGWVGEQRQALHKEKGASFPANETTGRVRARKTYAYRLRGPGGNARLQVVHQHVAFAPEALQELRQVGAAPRGLAVHEHVEGLLLAFLLGASGLGAGGEGVVGALGRGFGG